MTTAIQAGQKNSTVNTQAETRKKNHVKHVSGLNVIRKNVIFSRVCVSVCVAARQHFRNNRNLMHVRCKKKANTAVSNAWSVLKLKDVFQRMTAFMSVLILWICYHLFFFCSSLFMVVWCLDKLL